MRGKRRWRWAFAMGGLLGVAAGGGTLRLFSLTVTMPDDSMEPTLHRGDVVLVAKARFDTSPPQRGDIVLVLPREGEAFRLRRVVGLPGETVQLENDDLKVNGEVLAEPYAARGALVSTSPIPLRERQVLLLPDNRKQSVDPAEFIPVPLERLMGRATWVIYPFSHWQGLSRYTGQNSKRSSLSLLNEPIL